MTTPSPTPDRVENPWKKRRKGPQQFMPPSRALFAEKDGLKATATWIPWFNYGWKCTSTGGSGLLCWMRGSTEPGTMPARLKAQGITWHWIEPNAGQVLPEPF